MVDLFRWAEEHGVSGEALLELFTPPIAESKGFTGGENTETSIQKRIVLATNTTRSLLLRNNSGAFKNSTGRFVRFGLGNESAKVNARFKSSDLIGVTPVLIEPCHVGRTFGVFTAVETKAPGWNYRPTEREKAQKYFLEVFAARGAICCFASKPGTFVETVNKFIRG